MRELGGIKEYRLPNGLQVLLLPDESQETTLVNITYKVGSRHENYGETGMAHLLEHMVFKGTPTHAAIPKLLQERGAQFNGTTWVDRTNYYETLPANPENLEFALSMEADRMVNSFIAAEALASEMTVVRNEFERGENLPSEALEKEVWATAYHDHPYHHSTIGWRSDFEKVPIEKLRAFYDTFYWPNNATVTIIGDFDTGEALMPRGIGTLITMQISGLLVRRGVDPRILIAAGFTIAAISLWEMSLWSLQTDYSHIAWSGFIQGLGMGLVFMPMNASAFATIPPPLRTDGSSLLNLSRSIGSSIGISVVTTLLSRNLQVSHSDLASHITPSFMQVVDFSTLDRFQEAGEVALRMVDAEINRDRKSVV